MEADGSPSGRFGIIQLNTQEIKIKGNMFTIYNNDCLAQLKGMPDNSIDSIVTDPPYGLSFMGKKWDYDVPSTEIWAECLRVLKPGGHLLAFAGTRTQHRMAVRIEDAGFEIRDMIAWVYGSGFPKSLDVSKAIDKAAGAEREVVGFRPWSNAKMDAGQGVSGLRQTGGHAGGYESDRVDVPITAPATEAARQWQGWGTALKPALEPITVARKPLVGTVAANVLTHGTGALNIDGCRVPTNDKLGGGGQRAETSVKFNNEGWRRPWMTDPVALEAHAAKVRANVERAEDLGRWPANLIHDGSEEVLEQFPQAKGQQGKLFGSEPSAKTNNTFGDFAGRAPSEPRGDSGSAARFFYCAKTSKKDRGDGNNHPTVKPTELMRYLCRLVTPPNGTVLDPFMGSGSTGKAAVLEGFNFIGIELDPAYVKVADQRINLGET